jgi:hypothetical protein
MSQHLSSERISMWIAGERTPEDEEHVRVCLECAAELARFQATLSLFRDSVRDWSSRQPGSEPGTVPKLAPARWAVRWAMAAAALLLVATVSIYRGTRQPQFGGLMLPADVALLEQVDAEVSRGVPRGMEPLLELVSTDYSTGEEDNETTQ